MDSNIAHDEILAEVEAQIDKSEQNASDTASENTTKLIPGSDNFYNLDQIFVMIEQHYNKKMDNIRFAPPAQFVDGCSVDFIDANFGEVVATGRLRYRNLMNINSNGQAFILVQFSDITFGRQSAKLTN